MDLFAFIHHADPTKIGRIDIVADEEVQAIIADKPKVQKRKFNGASGSNHPPKKQRTYHGILEPATKRFVVLSYSSNHSSTNVVGDEVTSIVRLSMPLPYVLTVVVATTITIGPTSALVYELDAAKGVELTSLIAQTAKLTRELSELGLSCDELSIKASSLEAERDGLVGQVSALNATCSEFCNEVIGYKLFKKRIESVQDEQVRILSDRVAGLDFELMGMALYMDKRYLATLRGAIGRAIDKGMQDGLAAEADYVFAINALHEVDFPLLAQLRAQKDASMVDIMDLLCLEGPAAETLEASQLQPSLEQLMFLIHRLEDQVVTGETSLSFSLEVAYSRIQRLMGEAASKRLSLSDALAPLVESLSVDNLIGESSTSSVPAAIALSTTFVKTGFVPSIPHV
nr:hypothetical protein [Tanacetum cinerariifolium]